MFMANRYATFREIRYFDGELLGYQMLANYDGVTAGIRTDPMKKPQTIFPDAEQSMIGGGHD